MHASRTGTVTEDLQSMAPGRTVTWSGAPTGGHISKNLSYCKGGVCVCECVRTGLTNRGTELLLLRLKELSFRLHRVIESHRSTVFKTTLLFLVLAVVPIGDQKRKGSCYAA
ncbi:hypothetical protein UY3_10458 [Chelonia mydas]|uniref:Uncharacterized protein n=1 Tax=Chelonia mydas TaxID=8469 RepID=M7B3C3_CHEMY|nr:hypothetical protein UY3_10458 [Chelonia mydas]